MLRLCCISDKAFVQLATYLGRLLMTWDLIVDGFTRLVRIKVFCEEFNAFSYHGHIKDMVFFPGIGLTVMIGFLGTRVMLPSPASPI
jgi:hypothetical protein